MKFPIIKTIDDVLPAIKGHDEFIVAERPFGSVINYLVALEDSFDDPIRRECRGIVFYPDGTLMSRPYHKFFNIGERNESRPANLDFGLEPVIMDKLDGSMIRPIWTADGDRWEFGTKMGVTDVAQQAYQFVWENAPLFDDYDYLMDWCHTRNITPLFEWCSNQQRIVVSYPEEQLVLTGARVNETGQYLEYWTLKHMLEKSKVPVVKTWTKGAEFEDLQEYATVAKDIEGWVVAWPDGKRVKMKVDWYVTLHKVKDAIAREKYVIEAILGDFLDDLKGKLLETDLKNVEKFEKEFTAGVWKLVEEVGVTWQSLQIASAVDRDILSKFMESGDALDRAVKKQYAGYVKDKPSWMRPILFGLNDGKIPLPVNGVYDMLRKCTQSQPMIDNNRHLWGGARYLYNEVIE